MSLSAIALFLIPFFVPTAAATERWAELWTEADGLPSQNVISVSQGSDGTIWLSTLVGPVRYDGHSFERVGEPIPTRRIRFGPSGVLQIPRSRRGRLRWVERGAVEGPDAKPLTNVRAAIEHEGGLWVGQGSVVRTRIDGVWRDGVDTGGIVRRFQVSDGQLLATSSEGIWRVAPGPVERLVDHPKLVAGLQVEGSWLLADEDGRLLRLDDPTAAAEVLVEGLGFPASGVVRQGVVWWAFDRGVVRIGPDARVERVEMPDVGSPGELFVDREGSLWIPGVRGLARFPEPDTVLWTVADGVPGTAIDGIVPAGPHRWLRTRDVAIRLGPDGVVARGTVRKPLALCVDAEGVAWTGGGVPPVWAPIVEVEPGAGPLLSVDDPFRGCASGPAGTFIALGTTIHRASMDLQPVGSAPPGVDAGELLAAGSSGDRWGWLVDEQFCTADPEGPWTCGATPVAFDQVVGDWAVGDGRLWRGPDPWMPVATEAPVTAIGRAQQGIWALGVGLADRLNADGEVVERLGGRHGVFDRSPTALLEDPDGTLWVGSLTGVTRVPAHARTDIAEPPAVSFADIQVDGLTVPPDALGAALDIPWDQNHLTVRLAARAYRDPQAVRYRMRIDGDELEADDGVFRFVGLGSGTYRLVGRASLDGQTWSPPATLVVNVAPAPWLRWWAIALYGIVLGAIATVLYQLRVRYLLGLERQRARIALDLHDEVGSGLGSIGLLATALPLLEDPEQADEAASAIAATSAELGDALTDIVWALKPESKDVANVLAFLEQRGRALFADGATTLTVIGPDVNETFTLPVLRTVTGIALEAMYNAARHAHAEAVEVRLVAGDPWVLSVTDDGDGIDPEAPVRAGGGSGLAGMKTRAASIGATLELASGARGTSVALRFDPHARDVRIA